MLSWFHRSAGRKLRQAAASYVFLTIIADSEAKFKMAPRDGCSRRLRRLGSFDTLFEMPDCSLQVHWTVIRCDLVGRGERRHREQGYGALLPGLLKAWTIQ